MNTSDFVILLCLGAGTLLFVVLIVSWIVVGKKSSEEDYVWDDTDDEHPYWMEKAETEEPNKSE